MISVIIVDDHQMFIDGIKGLIQSMPDIRVVGEANNGIDLIDVLADTKADAILMDMSMPKMNGLEATKHVIKHYPDIKVLMLTMHDSRNHIEKLLKAGASGYVLKNTGIEELQQAIETVVSGKTYYSPEVTQRIMEGFQQKKKLDSVYGDVDITDREKEVLALIAQEFTTAEIAEKLFISPHTVESHRKNLISKLGVRSAAGLVKYAVQIGLVD
jgi:two-component system, NarL family, nitrate/nitrite response regulator NarL